MSNSKDDKVFVAKCGCLINNSSGVVDLFPCKEGCDFQKFFIAYMSKKMCLLSMFIVRSRSDD